MLPSRPATQSSRSAPRKPRQPATHPLGLRPPERIAHKPEHRWPESNEQGPALGVVALVFPDRLRPNPEGDALHNRDERQAVEIAAARFRVREMHASSLTESG